jgi:enoyl-CoA hydratase/carnithine racemase
MDEINAWVSGDDLAEIVDRISLWQGDDPWLIRARDGLVNGSKLAAAWIFRQLNETREANLEAVFSSELRLAAHIMRHPEFSEGVRALLIDKDRNPQWSYDAVGSVPDNVLDGFFVDAPGAPQLELS